MCKPASPHPQDCWTQWEIPGVLDGRSFKILLLLSFRPQQEVEVKLGGAWADKP